MVHHQNRQNLAEKWNKYAIFIVLLMYSVIGVFTIVFYNGTADDGDSVNHYLFAKYSLAHHELFFHQWAKPVFVLLSSPFAQFGFTGMKIFNLIVSLCNIYLTYQIAVELRIKNAVLVAVILVCSPLNFVLTFSGLTEPLFALFLAGGILLCSRQKYLSASVLISFLPFVRSEGLMIIGVFGLYLLLKQQWKPIFLLATGHIVYSFSGYFIHHDLLWIFNKIPYARLSSTYGHGTLFHFVNELFYVIGLPIYGLFAIGLISGIKRSIEGRIKREEQFLVYMVFLVFFIAHSLFWYLGIFNSMGLKRVLIGVMPAIAIIALQGYNWISEMTMKSPVILKRSILSLIIIFVLVFPFIPNPAAIHPQRDLCLSQNQKVATGMVKLINDSLKIHGRYLYAAPSLGALLQIDPFDSTQFMALTTENINNLRKGDLIIWDDWFAVVENQIIRNMLDNNIKLRSLKVFKGHDGAREIIYAMYEKR